MSLATNVTNLATRIATEVKALRTLINGNAADLSALDTTAKTNLVAAINEVNAIAEGAAGGGATIDDTTASTSTVYSSTKTNSQITAAVDAVVAAAPGALNTLDELAAALGDDAAFATTVTNSLAAKAPLASPALTGTPTAPTASGGTNTTQLATTAFVQAAAPAASETAAGKVELATNAEVITGSDTTRAVTPAGLANAYGDSASNYVTTFEAGLV